MFELVNNGGGSYTPVTLLSFNGANGAGPVGGLIADAAGDLFGATAGGGAAGYGTVFEITNSGFVTKGSTTPPATSSDILWRNSSSGDVQLWIPNGSGGFTFENLGDVPSGWQVEGTGDFNGSGEDGILWRNANGDVAALEREWLGGLHLRKLGRRLLQLAGRRNRRFQRQRRGRHPVAQSSSGDVELWNSNGSGGFQNLGDVGSGWQIEGTGDFNGSGADGVLWQNSDGDVELWNSNGSGGFTFQNLGDVPSGWQIFKQG